MSFNAKKMVGIILNEKESIENRCPGYREKILDAIVEILNAEKEHKEQRTTIQKNVDDACHKAGDFLTKNRNMDSATTEQAK